MKQWFPFTDYEFYAYLISGMLLIGAVDYTLAGAVLVHKTNWTVVEGVVWTTLAYLVGQVAAAPSAALLEHLIARKWMHSPAEVQLGIVERSRFERWFSALFAPREYAPLSSPVRESALNKARSSIAEPETGLTGEIVFQAAFHPVRQFADTNARLAIFLNQYGFSRNVAFASSVALILLLIQELENHTRTDLLLVLGAATLAVGMFGRFVKFYSAYSADVLRSYATLPVDGSD